jgi:predicted TIM-barrel fold metal-dependent hydrolase
MRDARPAPGSKTWLALADEAPIDPERPIIDPHHHLWPATGTRQDYLLANFWADSQSGHAIEKSVFVETRASYRTDGPEALRPVGETEFVARIARASCDGGGGAVISAIVAYADLRAPKDELKSVLRAHEETGEGLFRGIRQAGAFEANAEFLIIRPHGPAGLYASEAFRAGVSTLGELGLSYDAWHYHHQNPAFADLARAVPGTTMVLDHFGTPLGVGPYATRREAIFEQWKHDIAEIAKCPNVVAKIGGLAMPDNGFGWQKRETPASSDELVEAQARYYHHAIECFGPSRCMFESNFPVDRRSLPYSVYWNAAKKIARRYSADEQHEMFYGTAQRVYRL